MIANRDVVNNCIFVAVIGLAAWKTNSRRHASAISARDGRIDSIHTSCSYASVAQEFYSMRD
jgi:hypothetical protein